ncbi:type II CRISPR RNA-guided endonuclease Cas9 [Mollicutes bacterium LVI A0039]|nr:type II CRISPR RNA-guided endonuclease Cas9 [Mollicutes bacterium LVI A0039]
MNVNGKEIKYTLGLDIGVASVGWAVINLDDKNHPTHIVDTGVIKVQSMEDDKGNLINASRRANRGSRRTLRRRQHRVLRMKNLLKTEFGFSSITDIYENSNTNVYELKVNGLQSKLTDAEISKCLIHYCKHRGFKSNRKKGSTSAEDGKILKAILENKERLGEMHVSELLFKELDGKTKIKNGDDGYNYSFDRELYEKELNAFLDKQIEFNVIDDNFKDNALKIWSSQRDFSDGPGGESNYKVDFANVFGKCTFEREEFRAPRYAYSQEVNTVLGKLSNLRYKREGEHDYVQLESNQIVDLLAIAKTKKELKLGDVAKYLKSGNIKFKGNRISRDRYIKCINKYREAKGVSEVDTNSIEFKTLLLKEEYATKLVEMKAYHIVRNTFKNHGGVELFDNLPTEYKDDLAVGLTFYKTDERIKAYFEGVESENNSVVTDLDWDLYPEVVKDVIPNIPDNIFKEAASLSLTLLRRLNELMLTGLDYVGAMEALGYQHSVLEQNAEKKIFLREIRKILDEQYPNEISNPRVIRVLNKSGSLINSVITQYGSPYFINIEVARDINLKANGRRQIENEQLENLNKNEHVKALICENNPSINYSSISKYDIEKYKLFMEQDGRCAYTGDIIKEGWLLTSEYEIDHIIPYSKSKLNSFTNKTLVTKKANQEKGDRVPLEYLSQMYPDKVSQYRKNIEGNYKLSDKKKEYYLMKSLADLGDIMTDGSLEDTRFITKYLVKILENNLVFSQEGNDDKKRVVSHKAGYVNYFKKACRVNNFTHSLENPEYKRKVQLNIVNLSHASKDKAITLKVEDLISNKVYEETIKIVKTSDKSPEYIKMLNQAIEDYHMNNHLFDIDSILGLPLEKHGIIVYDLFDEIENQITEKHIAQSFHRVFSTLKINIMKSIFKKNRDNHLHHALDAIVTASLTRSTQQKLSDYDKKRDDIINAIKKTGAINLKYLNWKQQEVEVVLTNIDEFFEIENEFLRNYAPLPFENFVTEVKAFVYEQDMDKKKAMLDDGKYRSIRPLIPVQTQKLRYNNTESDTRISSLHKETVYGELDNQLTKRISVKDLTKEKAEKIVLKDTSNIKVYEACIKWIASGKQAEYPMLENGRLIKKVKIFDGDINKAIDVGRGFVASDNVVRIDVYKQENDDRLYFLAQNAMSIAQNNQDKEFKQTIWFGQGKNYIVTTNKQIEANYTKVVSLHPGELVEITKKVKKEYKDGYCYINGFTGGELEVKSLMGDNYDLNTFFEMKIDTKRQKITVSTIKSIKKKKVTIRGVVK